ncbi:DNA topoisomerase IV subunit B [Spiroplasma endosymbiont of Amphibalanus improvisus]|uniref:DNA topoisomerase IV subunit B n=1 Tax=Spiroplasma endosymbiont of Amphibalanus improvisus TaxID=3066327 RepID=UPI00313CFF3A
MANNNYDESSIIILEGLAAVRKRPGMYIGSTDSRGLHHLIWEIVDNSIDESLAGYCDEITVDLLTDDFVSVEDNGRGVPTGKHKNGKSTPEVIFSILHAGGKFGSGGYKTSGGLHGVGSSVVNALSDKFDVVIHRDKQIHAISFANGGNVAKKLKQIGTTKKTGTIVKFHPDPLIFKEIKFSFSTICYRLQESAFLNDNLKININDHKNNRQVTYQYSDGIQDFMNFLNEKKKKLTDVILLKEQKGKELNIKIAIQYTDDFNENILSFANNVKTPDGGTHLTGFKSGLLKAVNKYARDEGILKEKEKNLDSYDIREGLSAIISIQVNEKLIQYEGQTKSKLGTPEAKVFVDNFVSTQFLFWLKENKKIAYEIIQKALLARSVREQARKARDAARKNKGKSRSNLLVGKLTPPQGKNKAVNELFLVEGDSAGGSAKGGRDSSFQGILPLRGKVINSQKSKLADVLKNEEINAIINSIGAGLGNSFEIEDANYAKIIIMTDADTDGAHIQTLLLTFFYRYMRQLIENKRIYVALPPLYKITNKRTKEYSYAWEDDELAQILENMNDKYELQRYKGLGEMNADQLWETTMNPDTRQLILVNIDDLSVVDKQVDILMGDDTAKRKDWINENVKFISEKNEYIKIEKNDDTQ